jgi:hypothetical protein
MMRFLDAEEPATMQGMARDEHLVWGKEEPLRRPLPRLISGLRIYNPISSNLELRFMRYVPAFVGMTSLTRSADDMPTCIVLRIK